MKTKLFTIILLLFSSQVFAETYDCQYTWNGEKFELLFEKTKAQHDGKTYEYYLYKQKKKKSSGTVDSEEEILFEDSTYLVIGWVHQMSNGLVVWRTAWLDKATKKFRMSMLKEPSDSFHANNLGSEPHMGIYGTVDGTCK
tara:strand:+ start:218 stop:640 length:423 start_codon:yes stop_codon:yes gene_type:complete